MRSGAGDCHVIREPLRRIRRSGRPASLISILKPGRHSVGWENQRLSGIALTEIATVTARGLAGQPVKCSSECARIAEADITCDGRDGQFAIRQ
jgi:hypothetical protein